MKLVEAPPFSFQRFHEYECQLSSELVNDESKALAQIENVGDFHSILLAIAQVLLYRYTGQSNILVSFPIAVHSHANYDSAVNSLASFRTHIYGDLTFQMFLAQVDHHIQVAISNSSLFKEQYDGQQDEAQDFLHLVFVLESDGAGFPIVPTPGMAEAWNLTEKPTQSVDISTDLSLIVVKTERGFSIRVKANPSLFEAATVQRMMEQLQPVLESVVANPKQPIAQLPILSLADSQQLLVKWNQTARDDVHDYCIHEWFENQAQQTPEAIAVVFDREQLTYQQLNQQANQLAHHLQVLGVERETLVGICIDRSPLMVIALLAVLKAGGACVPLDPAYPSNRLTAMLVDAHMHLLLTTATLLPLSETISQDVQGCAIVDLTGEWQSISQRATDNPVSLVKPHHLAYVLYTSGSTGKPKGVMMEHLSLVNLINWHLQCRITAAKTLQFAPLSFDISFHEIFATWCSGGTLVLISEAERRNPEALFNFILAHGIEKIYLPFTALQQLVKVSTGKVLPTLREVMTAGEQLQILPHIAQFFQQNSCTLHNHYGATECQDVTAFTLSEDVKNWVTLPSIGRPIHNTQVYLLDEWYQLVPIGVVGELYIGGQGIARGYLNRPDLTAERFIANPFGHGRLYKTGDLACYLPDGNLQHLGRADRQVKIRGFRIELGEIEGLLVQHPLVEESAVILREDVPGNKRLVSYIVPSHPVVAPDLESIIHSYLRDQLPDYMVPAAVVVLEQMPITPSGKLDRRGLPVPPRSILALATELVLPQTQTEKQIAQVWQDVLQIQAVSINHNFFEVGGSSLLLLQVYEKLVDRFGDRLTTITLLFQYPTIQTLAQTLDQGIQAISLTHQRLPLRDCYSTAAQQKQRRQAHRADQRLGKTNLW